MAMEGVYDDMLVERPVLLEIMSTAAVFGLIQFGPNAKPSRHPSPLHPYPHIHRTRLVQ